MSRWLGLLAGAVCAVAALLMLPRLWRVQESPRPTTASRPGTAGVGSARPPVGAGTATNRASSPRLAAQPRSDSRAASSDRGVTVDGPRAGDHAIPAGGSGADQAATDADGDQAPVIPEVAYRSKPEERFETGAQAELSDAGPLSGEAGTVAFWLKPDWAPDSQDDASFVQFGD